MQSTIKGVFNDYSENDDGKYEDWMQSVKATLGMLDKIPWYLSIYKVPNKLRRLKEDAYNPRIVSIGPSHASNHELVALREHKWHCMLNFVRRAAAPHVSNYDVVTSPAEEANDQGNKHPSVTALEECGKAILELEEKARACYAEKINLGKHQLVKILLLDGCFILELFIKHTHQYQDQDKKEKELDSILDNLEMVPALQHDLALLENQIPFGVLQTLFDTIQKLANMRFRLSLKKYVLLFFRSALNLSDEVIEDMCTCMCTSKCTCTPEHIADLLHRVVYTHALLPSPKRILEGKIEWGFKRCATQLVKSGFQIQASVDKDRRLLDITFSDGVITIPPLYIQEVTDSVFRNLVAFEQCNIGCSRHMASYARLMKTLISSPQDAELLRVKGIITTNKVGGDEEVSTFFQSLCREVVFTDFYFSDLCEKVNTYKPLKIAMDKDEVKIRWNRYFVSLQNEHLNTPWTIISLVAALVLLILTAVQTFYSVRSYYPH